MSKSCAFCCLTYRTCLRCITVSSYPSVSSKIAVLFTTNGTNCLCFTSCCAALAVAYLDVTVFSITNMVIIYVCGIMSESYAIGLCVATFITNLRRGTGCGEPYVLASIYYSLFYVTMLTIGCSSLKFVLTRNSASGSGTSCLLTYYIPCVSKSCAIGVFTYRTCLRCCTISIYPSVITKIAVLFTTNGTNCLCFTSCCATCVNRYCFSTFVTKVILGLCYVCTNFAVNCSATVVTSVVVVIAVCVFAHICCATFVTNVILGGCIYANVAVNCSATVITSVVVVIAVCVFADCFATFITNVILGIFVCASFTVNCAATVITSVVVVIAVCVFAYVCATFVTNVILGGCIYANVTVNCATTVVTSVVFVIAVCVFALRNITAVVTNVVLGIYVSVFKCYAICLATSLTCLGSCTSSIVPLSVRTIYKVYSVKSVGVAAVLYNFIVITVRTVPHYVLTSFLSFCSLNREEHGVKVSNGSFAFIFIIHLIEEVKHQFLIYLYLEIGLVNTCSIIVRLSEVTCNSLFNHLHCCYRICCCSFSVVEYARDTVLFTIKVQRIPPCFSVRNCQAINSCLRIIPLVVRIICLQHIINLYLGGITGYGCHIKVTNEQSDVIFGMCGVKAKAENVFISHACFSTAQVINSNVYLVSVVRKAYANLLLMICSCACVTSKSRTASLKVYVVLGVIVIYRLGILGCTNRSVCCYCSLVCVTVYCGYSNVDLCITAVNGTVFCYCSFANCPGVTCCLYRSTALCSTASGTTTFVLLCLTFSGTTSSNCILKLLPIVAKRCCRICTKLCLTTISTLCGLRASSGSNIGVLATCGSTEYYLIKSVGFEPRGLLSCIINCIVFMHCTVPKHVLT